MWRLCRALDTATVQGPIVPLASLTWRFSGNRNNKFHTLYCAHGVLHIQDICESAMYHVTLQVVFIIKSHYV